MSSKFILIELLLALVGLIISVVIVLEKRLYRRGSKRELICPLKMSCETVLHSPYASCAGLLSWELLGVLYYGFLGVFLFFVERFLLGLADLPGGLRLLHLNWSLLGFSSLALVVSVYLFAIQVFKLKEFCSWCLGSGLVSVLIWSLSLYQFLSS